MAINLKLPDTEYDFKLKQTKLTDYIKKELKVLDKEMNQYFHSSLSDEYPATEENKEFEFHSSTMFFEIVLFIKPIGFIIAVPGKNKETVWLSDFYLEKKYRSKGYGTKSLNKFKVIIKELGYKAVVLTVFNKNINAVKLYEKIGFDIPISKTIACKL